MPSVKHLGPRNTLFLVYGALVVAVVSCQLVAGIKSRSANPLPAGCFLPGVVPGNPPSTVPAQPLVRIANLIPTSDLIDVCMRPAGASSWGNPILLNGGTGTDDAGAIADNGCAAAASS